MIKLKRLLLASVLSTMTFASDSPKTLFPKFTDTPYLGAMASIGKTGDSWGDSEFTIDLLTNDETEAQRLDYHRKYLSFFADYLQANASVPDIVKRQIPSIMNRFINCWKKLTTSSQNSGVEFINYRDAIDCLAALHEVHIINCHNALVLVTYIGDILQQQRNAWAKPIYSINQNITMFQDGTLDDKNNFLQFIMSNKQLLWSLYTNSPYIIDLINISIISAQKLLKDNPYLLATQDMLVVNMDQLVIKLAQYFPALRGVRVNPNNQRLISAPVQLEKSRSIARILDLSLTDEELQDMGLKDWPHGQFDLTVLNSHLFPEREGLHLGSFLILKQFLQNQEIENATVLAGVFEHQISLFHSSIQNLKHVAGGQTTLLPQIYDTLEQLNMNLTKLWYDFEVALGKKHYSDSVTFIGWNNRVTKDPEPYALIGGKIKPTKDWNAFIQGNSSKLIAFMQASPAVQDVINLTVAGAIHCLRKLSGIYENEFRTQDKKCKDKRTPLRDRKPFIDARAATKEKLDNIAAIIANMNALIQNLTQYFPHLKGVKVGKAESETLVFDKFEKPLDASTAKKKEKKKKSKAVDEKPAEAVAETTAAAEPEAAPVIASDDKPVELPAASELEVKPVVIDKKADSSAAQPTLERSTSVREIMTVDERRRMIDERRRSRQLQRTESGCFVKGVDYQAKPSSRPPLERTQSVLFTRVSKVLFAKTKHQKKYDTICDEYPEMIAEIMANPWATSGLGSPELLSGNFAGYISRRLNDKDRLVYKADRDKDGNVILTIMSVSGHYTKGKS